MTTGELIRALLAAFVDHDEAAFRVAAHQVIEEERRKNHRVLANDLERLLSNGSHRSRQFNQLDRGPDILPSAPVDKERGMPLVRISNPTREFEELVLDYEVRLSLSRVVEENRHADLLRTYGLGPVKKLLFCGPPGCGKTATAEALANTLNLPLVLVRFDAVVSSYLGETAANLSKVMDYARRSPAVYLFDEFDAIGKKRDAEEEHGELKRVVNSFLQMLDGFRGESLIIAATNHQGLLDPALWRRFDDIVFFDMPSQEQAVAALAKALRNIGVEQDVNLKQYSESLADLSFADIEHVAVDAAKRTILAGESRIRNDVLRDSIQSQRQRAEVSHAASSHAPRLDEA